MKMLIAIILLSAYLIINLITTRVLSAKQMKEAFIDGQCVVGRIFANIFYLPAWFFKGLKFVVMVAIK